MRICFDMDGTIANLYAVEGWLDDIFAENARPYEIAKVLINMNSLARVLNRLQRQGYEIGIISWLSDGGRDAYKEDVEIAKRMWLKKHSMALIKILCGRVRMIFFLMMRLKIAKTGKA